MLKYRLSSISNDISPTTIRRTPLFVYLSKEPENKTKKKTFAGPVLWQSLSSTILGSSTDLDLSHNLHLLKCSVTFMCIFINTGEQRTWVQK